MSKNLTKTTVWQICFATNVLLLFVAAAIYGYFTSWQASDLDLTQKLLTSSKQHWLGTDQFGRDIVMMLCKGAKTSLVIALLSTLFSLFFGILIGAIILISPVWLRYTIYYCNTLLQVFPALLIAIMLLTVIGAGKTTLILAIGIAGIPTFVRLTIACGKSLLPRQFVLAAKTAGLSNWQIFYRHLLPNMTGAILVQANIKFVIAILAESALSYLGFGIQPPEVSWGKMLSEAQNWIFIAPHLALYPGLVIALVALSVQWLNDSLHDFKQSVINI